MNRIIWLLCSNRWNSAITEYALRAAQALALRGWRVELSALPGSPCEKRAREFGVKGPSSRFSWRDVPSLRRHGHALKPSFILTFGGPETVLARVLGRPVVRFRGQDRDLAQPLSALSLRSSVGYCRAVLVPALALAERFRSVLPATRVESVTLGLDARVFGIHSRNPSPRPILLIVGRLDPIKGHREFLEVFARLLARWHPDRPRPLLKIIGQSSNVTPPQLRAQAHACGLEEGRDWSLLDARVPDLPQQMADATLGIIPSLGSEVIGRVAEEFLLSGTPIAISGVGTLRECLREESFGLNLQGADPLPLLETWILRAFGETDAERSLRSSAARDHFSLEAMGKALEGFLETL